MKKPSIFRTILWQLGKRLHFRKLLSLEERNALCDIFLAMCLKHLPKRSWKQVGSRSVTLDEEFGSEFVTLDSSSEFVTLEGSSEQIFFTGITDQQLELSIKIGMGVIFLEVEEVWQKSQNENKRHLPWTVKGMITKYRPGAELFYQMDNDYDLQFIEPQIAEIIEKACVPFWKDFATIQHADANWNKRPFDFDLDGTDALHHGSRSIIIAHLVRNPNFEDLVKMRRSEIQSKLNPNLVPEALQQFERLVNWLCSENGSKQ